MSRKSIEGVLVINNDTVNLDKASLSNIGLAREIIAASTTTQSSIVYSGFTGEQPSHADNHYYIIENGKSVIRYITWYTTAPAYLMAVLSKAIITSDRCTFVATSDRPFSLIIKTSSDYYFKNIFSTYNIEAEKFDRNFYKACYTFHVPPSSVSMGLSDFPLSYGNDIGLDYTSEIDSCLKNDFPILMMYGRSVYFNGEYYSDLYTYENGKWIYHIKGQLNSSTDGKITWLRYPSLFGGEY